MGLTLAKCPSCGADLNMEIDRDYFYCPHCGSKVLQQDERIVIEHVSRTVDEAEVKKVEFERDKYKLEEQRIEKNRKENLPKAKKMMLCGIVVFLLGQILSRIENSMLSVFIWYVGLVITICGGTVFLTSYIGDVNNKASRNIRDKK